MEWTDFVDVVAEHVVLRNKGREFVGICPFHDDSKPSLKVSPAQQFYDCSCGVGSGAALPAADQDGGWSATGAASATAVPQGQAATGPCPGAGWFRSQLMAPAGAEPLKYLNEARGLSIATLSS